MNSWKDIRSQLLNDLFPLLRSIPGHGVLILFVLDPLIRFDLSIWNAGSWWGFVLVAGVCMIWNGVSHIYDFRISAMIGGFLKGLSFGLMEAVVFAFVAYGALLMYYRIEFAYDRQSVDLSTGPAHGSVSYIDHLLWIWAAGAVGYVFIYLLFSALKDRRSEADGEDDASRSAHDPASQI